ncbi:DUF6114 domain-containing protein [Myceligenerans pegani]|uniref:Uncharacterized protein n=1 Tax=Myceligenerans pegani TaxID=2776917 RepID=A0ABR9N4M7_9MICO|nr:DUF6114 domain-containing protein [Myceligenerans sp. TRM 65318]MBE1878608.1 hypothetical protein [Myceligenerans sp. TRM 65318]MBE3020879.1 hypothetical protein [Myceligenerans sp. TRM 65318]
MLLNPGDGQAGAARPGLRGRLDAARRAFGPWRRQRPFVGGVLVILAGLELLLSGPIDLGGLADTFGIGGVPDLTLGVGIEGFQATVLPIALILLGVLSVLQPVHRVFYGVIILAISVYTLSGVNLGGWVVGFLLGAIGGVVVVSWSPADAASAQDRSDDDATSTATSDGIFEVSDGGPPGGAESGGAAPGGPPGGGVSDGAPSGRGQSGGAAAGDGPQAPGGLHVVDGGGNSLPAKSAAVALAGALVLGGMQPTALRTAEEDCWDPISWIPIITCDEEGGDADPSESPSSSPSTSQSGDPDGGVVDDVTDGVGDVVDGVTGGSGDDSPGGAKDEGSGGSGDGASSDESDAAADELFSTDESERGLSIGYVCDGEKRNVTLPMIPAGEDNRNTFSLPADLRTKDLEISGIRSIALVSVPVTHEVQRRDAIRIVADHVKVPGFWLKTYAYDEGTEAGTETGAGYVSMDGNATMYLSGINLGCPDFEDIADEPPQSIIAWLLALSGAQIDFLGATSDVQVWSNFREQVWGDPLHPIGRGPEAGDP